MQCRQKLGELIETVAWVMAYAPEFPYRDYLPRDGQMTLNRIFTEIRNDLAEIAQSMANSAEITTAGALIEEAYRHYEQGERLPGLLKMQDVYHLLQKI